ncbi:hypothetical protein HYU13_06310, partial [Candidatus Woesearchaeota archaeon]|nr:hypothetical protein [Candidatus Woesearchaeota archaeon]
SDNACKAIGEVAGQSPNSALISLKKERGDDPWAIFYEGIKAVRKAYRSPEIIKELTYRAFLDTAAEASAFELRMSLVSMIGDYLANSQKEAAGAAYETAAREVLHAVLEGKKRALKELTVPAALRFGFSRQPKYLPQSKAIIPLVKEFAHEFSGLDVMGDERSSDLTGLRPIIEELRACLPDLTVHAGELKGPESVEEALSLHPQSIGHGIRSVEDDRVIDSLLENSVTLEICPTSNNTLIRETLMKYPEHPLVTLSNRGVKIVLGTDDPEIFNTTIQDEFEIAQKLGADDARIDKQVIVNHRNSRKSKR